MESFNKYFADMETKRHYGMNDFEKFFSFKFPKKKDIYEQLKEKEKQKSKILKFISKISVGKILSFSNKKIFYWLSKFSLQPFSDSADKIVFLKDKNFLEEKI